MTLRKLLLLLQPQNVLVTDHWHAKVADVGTARFLKSGIASGEGGKNGREACWASPARCLCTYTDRFHRGDGGEKYRQGLHPVWQYPAINLYCKDVRAGWQG